MKSKSYKQILKQRYQEINRRYQYSIIPLDDHVQISFITNKKQNKGIKK
jgi:hypothetical protein